MSKENHPLDVMKSATISVTEDKIKSKVILLRDGRRIIGPYSLMEEYYPLFKNNKLDREEVAFDNKLEMYMIIGFEYIENGRLEKRKAEDFVKKDSNYQENPSGDSLEEIFGKNFEYVMGMSKEVPRNSSKKKKAEAVASSLLGKIVDKAEIVNKLNLKNRPKEDKPKDEVPNLLHLTPEEIAAASDKERFEMLLAGPRGEKGFPTREQFKALFSEEQQEDENCKSFLKMYDDSKPYIDEMEFYTEKMEEIEAVLTSIMARMKKAGAGTGFEQVDAESFQRLLAPDYKVELVKSKAGNLLYARDAHVEDASLVDIMEVAREYTEDIVEKRKKVKEKLNEITESSMTETMQRLKEVFSITEDEGSGTVSLEQALSDADVPEEVIKEMGIMDEDGNIKDEAKVGYAGSLNVDEDGNISFKGSGMDLPPELKDIISDIIRGGSSKH